MTKPITVKEFTKSVMEILEASVSQIPEEEREQSKANVLEAFGRSMFYNGGPTKEKNT